MALWNVTFAIHHDVSIEADSREDAEEKACLMEKEEVFENSEREELLVWNVPYQPYLNIPLKKRV